MNTPGSEALSLFEGEGWVRVVRVGEAVPLTPTLFFEGEGAAR